ncbi:hypothetical protein I5L33_24085 [Serratia marcescens]|nr:hypothetical protein [Serratia marcescens]
MFAGKKSAQIREILISESAWEEMTCLFAPSLKAALRELMKSGDIHRENAHNPERKIGARRITVPAIKVAEIYYRHG